VKIVGAGEKVVVIIRPSAEGGGSRRRSPTSRPSATGRAVEMIHCLDPEEALAAAGIRGDQSSRS
jgi:hypothetical protein